MTRAIWEVVMIRPGVSRLWVIQVLHAVSLALLTARPAAAQMAACSNPILSVPCSISSGGQYFLGGDLTVGEDPGGAAIWVHGNQVTIDLNGYRLAGPNTTATRVNGIAGTPGIRNLTVRNGTLSGFLRGIVVDDNTAGNGIGHRVERVKVFGCKWVGIWLGGRDLVVRDNVIMSTQGTDFNQGGGIFTYGILAYGSGMRILNNDVMDTVAPASWHGRGIQVGNGTATNGAVVEGNRVSNAVSAPNSQGVVVFGPSDALVSDNRFNTLAIGIWWAGGGGKYRNNLTAGVTSPVVGGGIDAGNNQ